MEEVGVAVVPRILLDHVEVDPAQRDVVGGRNLGQVATGNGSPCPFDARQVGRQVFIGVRGVGKIPAGVLDAVFGVVPEVLMVGFVVEFRETTARRRTCGGRGRGATASTAGLLSGRAVLGVRLRRTSSGQRFALEVEALSRGRSARQPGSGRVRCARESVPCSHGADAIAVRAGQSACGFRVAILSRKPQDHARANSPVRCAGGCWDVRTKRERVAPGARGRAR